MKQGVKKVQETCLVPKPMGAQARDQYRVATVADDSLRNARIGKGDWVMFRLTPQAAPGQLIVVETPRGLTVKFYHPTAYGTVALRSADNQEQIYFAHQLTIKGVVASSGRDWEVRNGR